MKTWGRYLTSAGLALFLSGQIAAPAWAQPAPSSADAPATPPAPQAGVGVAGEVVHSWALAPAVDAPQGGNRPDLSYEAAPGTDVADRVTLYNFSNVELTFRLYATDAFNNVDGGFDLLPGDKKPVDVGTWITLPQELITVPARQQATMPITVKVPITARPGDHAGALLASSQAVGTGADGKTITLDRRTGSRIYVRVAGALSPKLSVEKLHASYDPSLNPLDGDATVTYRVQNRGNVRMAGRQRVSISGPLGLGKRAKASTELPELLPGEGVNFTVRFKSVDATAIAIAKVKLEPTGVRSSAGSASVQGRALAFAIPFTIVALALMGWLLARARRAYVRRQGGGAEVAA